MKLTDIRNLDWIDRGTIRQDVYNYYAMMWGNDEDEGVEKVMGAYKIYAMEHQNEYHFTTGDTDKIFWKMLEIHNPELVEEIIENENAEKFGL